MSEMRSLQPWDADESKWTPEQKEYAKQKLHWVRWFTKNGPYRTADEILLTLADERRKAVEECAKLLCDKCKGGSEIGVYPIAGAGFWHRNNNEHGLDRCAAEELWGLIYKRGDDAHNRLPASGTERGKPQETKGESNG